MEFLPEPLPCSNGGAATGRYARTSAHLSGEVFRGDAGFEDERDGGQCLAILNRPAAGFETHVSRVRSGAVEFDPKGCRKAVDWPLVILHVWSQQTRRERDIRILFRSGLLNTGRFRVIIHEREYRFHNSSLLSTGKLRTDPLPRAPRVGRGHSRRVRWGRCPEESVRLPRGRRHLTRHMHTAAAECNSRDRGQSAPRGP